MVYYAEPEYLVDFDPSASNSGGLTPTVPEVITEPVLLYDIRKFTNNLTFNQNASWNILSSATQQLFYKYLQKNQTQEGEEYATSLLDYIIINNNSPEAIEEIENILDLLDDGKIDGQDVVLAPDLPITNMTQYLSIFDTSKPAIITLSADQPIAGTHRIFGPDLVGHAFITIKQGTKIRSLGFYPESSTGSIVPNALTLNPTDFISVPGSFGNDQNHSYDVSISKSITATQLSNTLNGIILTFQMSPFYNISSMNCTDFAIIIFEGNTNIDIPSCESQSPWKGQTPGTLGEILRTIILPSGTTRNLTGGTAPSNNSN